ncbi:hypothetical protein [uncultured Sulfitobacter sp.]|uniref:hypothetical protein n=1 Tax=uncultured Sulfitobacter sp. TaxID=191468 RepID=UPI002614D511|nr:hypothetical protein [uncultured Sulfitobacter sp.]
MGWKSKAAAVGVAIGVLAGCDAPDPYATVSLPRGEQLDIRNILAANPNKRACTEYRAASNSCASIITSTVQGNTMISREIAAVKIPGSTQTQRVEVVTRSALRGRQACVRAGDINVTGRDQMSAFLLQATRSLVNDFGGSVCGSYFRAGDGYIVSSKGANGETFPPGDVRFQFITGEAQLRAQ